MNNDYRGWLQQSGNSWALPYVGNDYNSSNYGINTDKLSQSTLGSAPRPSSGYSLESYGKDGSRMYDSVYGKLSGLAQQYGSTVGGSGGGTTKAYQDPYAKWGGQSGFNNLMAGFDAQKGNIHSSASEAAGTWGNEHRGSIQQFIASLQQGQDNVNSSAINNILAKLQGQAGVQNMVGQGIKSGYTMLGNRNAGDSSASEGLARAYSEVGNREMRNVGNQYETNNREVENQQRQVDTQRNLGMMQLSDSKEKTVNTLVNTAREKLAELDIKMLEADMPTRIAIDQEKAAIKSAILGQLEQYDAMLRDQAGGVKASTFDQRQAEAAKMQSAGYDLGDKAFNFTSSVPAQLRNTGPFSSGLPIFSNRYRQED